MTPLDIAIYSTVSPKPVRLLTPFGGRKKNTDAYETVYQSQQPNLRIQHQFLELRTLKTSILNPRSILTDVQQKRNFLPLRQPLNLHRRIRQDIHRPSTNQDSHRSKYKEHDPPTLQFRILHVLKSKRNESPQNLSDGQSHEPELEARRRFRARVPLAADEHEAG